MRKTHFPIFLTLAMLLNFDATAQVVPDSIEKCEPAAQILDSKGKIWLNACTTGASAFVFDSKGGLVESYELSQGDNFFECPVLESGIYLAILTEKDGSTSTFSIAKA